MAFMLVDRPDPEERPAKFTEDRFGVNWLVNIAGAAQPRSDLGPE